MKLQQVSDELEYWKTRAQRKTEILKQKNKDMHNFDKSIVDLKDELFKLREENKALKQYNISTFEHKDYEIQKLKDINDRLSSQLAQIEQQNRILK